MTTNQKDTIYIDIDDEITTIIDKIGASKERIVALVLPKRATVLQSIVNMKLLKRSAENAKKHVVLITSESGLLPLAGAVGLYVAPSLQSKPVIPPVPEGMARMSPVDTLDHNAEDEGDFVAEEEATTPVGKLAGPAAFAGDEIETIEMDDDEPVAADASKTTGSGAAVGLGAGAAAAKSKKNGKLKIPDFNKFRLGLILGGALLVLLLVFGYFANFVLPKATVTIATDSSDIVTNANLALDPKAKELDPENKIIPAKLETKQQTATQQTLATGQKNKGTKASGQVTLSLKDCSVDEVTVPAGTGVSSGGKTFITQASATLESVKVGSKCSNSSFKNLSTQDVNVIAQTAGAAYNIAPSAFTVAGASTVSGQSDDPMTGGTDNIVKVISQTDVDTAKQKITSQDSSSVKADLKTKLESEGYTAVMASAQAGEPTVTTSASVGDEADTVTVTSVTTYTMYGVKKSDLETFITANVKDKIDPSKQKILNLGVDKASFEITSPATTGPLQTTLSATTLAGPDIKTDALKTQIKGKKTNDVRTIAKATPGVSDVTVKYSPFWVSKMPNKESKIVIVIQKTPASSNGNQP
jgi:hypothetical protein